MAAANSFCWKSLEDENLQELSHTVWGTNVSEDVFLRWSQGLSFGETEPTALLQRSGGPCAVIAPLQAYILKNILFRDNQSDSTVDLRTVPEAEVRQALEVSLCDILSLISPNGQCILVSYTHQDDCLASTSTNNEGESCTKRPKLFNVTSLHKQLKYASCSSNNLESVVNTYAGLLMDDFGVLCFLYSAVLTLGLDVLKQVISDTGETSLIDSTHGHGGQCLVNLLLTGEMTPHVFDGEKDAGGMTLSGISRQSKIGFLTLLESHRLLEVGWNYKNPVYPIWILASETHFTVAFSKSMDALQMDKQSEALRVVNSYDKEGNSFISSDQLAEVMSALNLLSEPEEYIQIIKEKLDPESLGIFMIANFMEEFFPKDKESSEVSQSFEMYHYNGIKGSNNCKKISYHRANARLKDFLEPTVTVDDSHILTCLQTKWPTIELLWEDGVIPSLN